MRRNDSQLPIALLRRIGPSAVAAMLAAFLATPAFGDGIEAAIDRLDPHPCPAGRLTCVTIPVPLDHDTPGDNRRLDIEFAVHPATGERRGTLVYFVGGPGQAGVSFGSLAIDWLDPDIVERYDIVFFDQRGTGPRHGVDCVEASTEYWMTHWDFDRLDAVVDSVQRFVTDCVAESGRADILPYLSTEQAARDVEAFRQAIGAPKLWLYGASYGTYIAQVYAATYPDAVEAVILDAVMDPAIDIVAESAHGAQAGEELFGRIAAACAADGYCRASFRTDPLSYYDGLMATLDEAPMTVMFPLSDGTLEERELTAEMLFGSLSMSLYTPYDRTSFLNVLASAENGDLVPLTRMGYRSMELDPDTLQPQDSAAAFDIWWGAFYGISCADYAVLAPDPAAGARAAIEDGLAQRAAYPRFFGYLIGLRPECQFWPTRGPAERPPLFTGGDYPTLILAADADAATPIANARAVFARIPNASMVTVRGGSHGLYGLGDTCVDTLVRRWLVDGDAPNPGNRHCDQTVLDAYRVVDVASRYAPERAADIAWGVIAAVETAAMSSGWEGGRSLRLGCSHGGTMTFRPMSHDEYVQRYRMDDCAIWPGVAVSGIAVYSDTGDDWGWEMELDVDGAHAGALSVAFDFINDLETVTGTLDDRPVGAAARSAIGGNGTSAATVDQPVKSTGEATAMDDGSPATARGANR